MMGLQDSVVVITGASKGLGRELAFAFADQTSRCVLLARSLEDLQSLKRELWDEKEGIASILQGSVVNPSHVRALKECAMDTYGHIDVWVNNAGVWSYGGIEDIEYADMQRMFEVNTFGTIYGSIEAYSVMKAQGRGTIVNIVSTSGKTGKKNESIYCATKFAARGFTESLQQEAKEHGVRVIPVYPGGMKSGFFKEYRPDMDLNGFMDPKDVAQLIVSAVKTPTNMLPELEIKRF